MLPVFGVIPPTTKSLHSRAQRKVAQRRMVRMPLLSRYSIRNTAIVAVRSRQAVDALARRRRENCCNGRAALSRDNEIMTRRQQSVDTETQQRTITIYER